MAEVKNVERRIRRVEGFDVRLRYERDGRDVRSDRMNVPQYDYQRKAPDDITAARFVRQRIEDRQPGLTAEVLDGGGRPVHGRTLLRNVRSTYG